MCEWWWWWWCGEWSRSWAAQTVSTGAPLPPSEGGKGRERGALPCRRGELPGVEQEHRAPGGGVGPGVRDGWSLRVGRRGW